MLLRLDARGEPLFVVAGHTGTAAWTITGPTSMPAVTKKTVHPAIFTPYSIASLRAVNSGERWQQRCCEYS